MSCDQYTELTDAPMYQQLCLKHIYLTWSDGKIMNINCKLPFAMKIRTCRIAPQAQLLLTQKQMCLTVTDKHLYSYLHPEMNGLALKTLILIS